MNDLELLEQKIEVKFKNKAILKNALIHRSYLNENKSYRGTSYEKLEFLGDSVLSLITSLYLFKNYPQFDEGEYTDIKASMVKTESLSNAAFRLNLGRFIYLSKGEKSAEGVQNKSILADCFEAIIAAIFLDGGFDKAYKFVDKFLFSKKIAGIIISQSYQSAKNRLQEYVQAKNKMLPVYKIIEARGPEHKKEYKIGVFVGETMIGTGVGNSKKSAQEEAARLALEKLKM